MDGIRIVKEKVTLDELKEIARERFGDMVKAVVDIEQKIMAVGAGMHADEEAILLDQGSKQKDLWGINIYPGNSQDQSIEFDSMINIRVWQGNSTRGVNDEKIRKQILEVVNNLTTWT